MEKIAQNIKEVMELYDRSVQLWTSLQEDEKFVGVGTKGRYIEHNHIGLEEG